MIENNCIIVNSIQIQCDYDEKIPGTFQVISVVLDTDFGEVDATNYIDQGFHYHKLSEVAKDLGFNKKIYIEEI